MIQKHIAEQLYFETDLTQKEIAEKAGISIRTFYSWMKAGRWQQLKQTTRQMPVQLVEDYYFQLAELHQSINQRDPGQRFPTKQEADISRKIVLNLDKIKKQASLPENMQVLTNFGHYLQSIDRDFAQKVIAYADKFIQAKMQNGYRPFEPEFEDGLTEADFLDPHTIHTPEESEIPAEPANEEIAAEVKQKQETTQNNENQQTITPVIAPAAPYYPDYITYRAAIEEAANRQQIGSINEEPIAPPVKTPNPPATTIPDAYDRFWAPLKPRNRHKF